jgi:hypothetical protein
MGKNGPWDKLIIMSDLKGNLLSGLLPMFWLESGKVGGIYPNLYTRIMISSGCLFIEPEKQIPDTLPSHS